MTPTRTERRPAPLRSPDRTLGLLVVAAVVTVVLVAPKFRPASYVPRLVVDNPTAYQVNVDIGGVGDEGRFDLGSVGRERESDREQVADVGPTWVFRFSYAGVDAGAVALSRDQLREAGWRVEVPAGVGALLEEAGFPPSAR